MAPRKVKPNLAGRKKSQKSEQPKKTIRKSARPTQTREKDIPKKVKKHPVELNKSESDDDDEGESASRKPANGVKQTTVSNSNESDSKTGHEAYEATPLNFPKTAKTKPTKTHASSSTGSQQSASTSSPKKHDTDEDHQSDTKEEDNQAAEDTDEVTVAQAPQTSEPEAAKEPASPKDDPKPKNRSKLGKPDIDTLFTPFPVNPHAPPMNNAWGTIPWSGRDRNDMPQPRSDQPPASTSDAATEPPLFEDRKYKFKSGRFQRTFKDEPVADPNAPANLDQRDNLVIPLMDMRPQSKHDPTPRRKPVHYFYKNGEPRDWTNQQALKALNDRRREAITRITCDPAWTARERKILKEICTEYPKASILEIAERFNHIFIWDFRDDQGFEGVDDMSGGRTLESIRHEYRTYSHIYENDNLFTSDGEDDIPRPKREAAGNTGAKKVDNRRELTAHEKFIAQRFGPADGVPKHKKRMMEEAYLEHQEEKTPENTEVSDVDKDASKESKPAKMPKRGTKRGAEDDPSPAGCSPEAPKRQKIDQASASQPSTGRSSQQLKPLSAPSAIDTTSPASPTKKRRASDMDNESPSAQSSTPAKRRRSSCSGSAVTVEEPAARRMSIDTNCEDGEETEEDEKTQKKPLKLRASLLQAAREVYGEKFHELYEMAGDEDV